MKRISKPFLLLGLCVIALACTWPAHGEETKPLESPIHMTTLPVSDEFRGAAGTHRVAISAAPPALIRDDSDANLSEGGRR